MKKLYGGTSLMHGFCVPCDDHTFTGPDMRCPDCGAVVLDERGVRRECEAYHNRRKPTPAAQRQILDEQSGACKWCENPFGSFARKRKTGRIVELRVHWDHFIPYAFTGSCDDVEFVASCHICNQAKSAQMFDTEDECRLFLSRRFAGSHEMIGDTYDLAVWLDRSGHRPDALFLLGKADATRDAVALVLEIFGAPV